MWDESRPTNVIMRPNSGSEVVVMDDRVVEASNRAQPPISNLSVTKSSRVHIGPKFVSVTQNVDNTGVVKGRMLCLELVSPQNAKGFRCSIAVFVCWALAVASTLAFLIFYLAFAKQAMRLDLDLPFHRYVWDVVKNTTKTERISCAVSLLLLIICIILIIYFTVIAKKEKIEEDLAPHEWYITRENWLANRTINNTDIINDKYNPLRLVIMAHTVSSECYTYLGCAAEMRELQSYYIKTFKYDIPYNFLIGNDGRVYEGRGWNTVGAHLRGYNLCALGVAFVGDYREGPTYTRLTAAQQWSAHLLFDQGIRMNYLHKDFKVVGAMDLASTLSPGATAYKAIQQWSQYAHDNVFKNRTCDQIKEVFDKENDTTTETIPSTNTITDTTPAP